MENILLEAWDIPKPRFIVSIIGGTKYFRLSDRLEAKFIDGIVDIARKAGKSLFRNMPTAIKYRLAVILSSLRNDDQSSQLTRKMKDGKYL